MDWTETILRLLPCLLIAGLIGGLIGWLLGRIFGSANATELLNSCQANLSSRDHELSGLRADLASSTTKYGSLQTEMATLAATLKTREAWIGEHEAKIKVLEADLDARISELDELKAESTKKESDLKLKLEESGVAAKVEADHWRAKLSEVEITAQSAKAAEDELANLKTNYAEKEKEFAQMSFRLKNLESLPVQLKEKDDQLASLAAGHASALDGKQSEILRLGVEVAAIGGLTATINSQANKIKALEEQLKLSSDGSTVELGKLREQLTESGNNINSLEKELASVHAVGSDKEAEITRLRGQVNDLEALSSQLKDRDSELAALRLRVGELEPLNEQFSANSHRVSELEKALHESHEKHGHYESQINHLQGDLKGKDSELSGLLSRITILEPLGTQLKDRDSEIAQLRLRVAELEPVIQEVKNRDARLIETDEELVRLRRRLVELEKEASAGTEKSSTLTAEYQSAIGAKDSEIAGLALKVGELTVISDQLQERDQELHSYRQKMVDLETAKTNELHSRDARIKELDDKLNSSLSVKDEEISQLTLRLTQLSSLTTQLAERDAELVALRKRLVELENGSTAGDEKVKHLESTYRITISNKDSEIARLNLRIGEITTLSSQLKDRDEELVALRQRLADLEKSSSQAATYEVEINQLRGRLSEIDALTRLLQERDAKLAEWDNRYQTSISERDRELSKLRARITELEMMSREVKERPKAENPKKSEPSSGAEKDDLKLIFGIGPVLERLLNEQGIYFFRDIATWGENEVRHYDHLLEDFRGRIERDDWISGAKEEHLKKYGEALQ